MVFYSRPSKQGGVILFKSKKGTSKNSKPKKDTFINKLTKKYKSTKVAKPKTTSQIMRVFFKDFNENNSIFQLDEKHFSICFEYQDISFSKANYQEQENIFLKWVEYLHSFNYNDHIQVICSGTPVKTENYKQQFIYNENGLSENERKISKEFNELIENCLGDRDEILCETRQIVITTQAETLKEAQDIFLQYQLRTEEKFKELKSKIRKVSVEERLTTLYNTFNTDLKEDKGINNFIEYAKENNLSIYDVLAPKDDVSFKEKNYINIGNKKFLRVLYVSRLPRSITPRFYNRITTIEDCNIITTLNITPTNPAKVIKMVNKKISGMKTERLEKIKKANKNNYSYEAVRDEKLEDAIRDAQGLRDALQKICLSVFKQIQWKNLKKLLKL